MKGRKRIISLVMAVMMIVVCLPQVALAAGPYKLYLSEDSVNPDCGSVWVISGPGISEATEITKTAINVNADNKPDKYKIEFRPNSNCTLVSASYEQKRSVELSTDQIEQKEIEIAIRYDTKITVEFAKNETEMLEKGTIDQSGESVYAVVDTPRYGNETTVTYTFTRPEPEVSVDSFSFKVKMKENSGAEETEATLYYFYNWYFSHDGVSGNYLVDADGRNARYAVTDMGDDPIGMTVEFDFELGKYRLVSGNGRESLWYDLTHGFSSYKNAAVTEVRIVGSDNLGESTTIGDLKINVTLTPEEEKAEQIKQINAKIAAIEVPDSLNYGNYQQVQTAVDEIEAVMSEKGIKITDLAANMQEKLNGLKKDIEDLLKNPVNEAIYLIDTVLPSDLNDITENNPKFDTYKNAVERLGEVFQSNPELAENAGINMGRYNTAKAKVEEIINKKALDKLLADLSKVTEVTNKNITECKAMINSIGGLLEALGLSEVPSGYADAYNKVIEGIKEIESFFDRYRSIDVSSSFNAIVFADTSTSGFDTLYDSPNFTSLNFVGQSSARQPRLIFSAASFEASKTDGMIYSMAEGNDSIPFAIATNAGLRMGGAEGTTGVGGTETIEVPLEQGIYEELYLAVAAHYVDSGFTAVVNFSEGDPMTFSGQTPSPNANGAFAKDGLVADTIKVDAAEKNPVMVFDNKNDGKKSSYGNTGTSSVYFPVIALTGLQGDGIRIIKSITLTASSGVGVAILGITAKMPKHEELGKKIEDVIDTLETSVDSIISNVDKIIAVKNMLEEYRSIPDADIDVSKREKFEGISKQYENNAVEITSTKNVIDYDSIRAVFEFKNPIDIEHIEGYVEVTRGGEVIAKPQIKKLSDRSFEVVEKNDLDYSKEYAITVSSALPNKDKNGFTLKYDYRYTFTPIAPMELTKFDVTGDLKNNSGGTVTASLKLKNNTAALQDYAVSVCLYNKDGELVKVYRNQGALAGGLSFEKADYSFILTDDASEIKCFILDSYAAMNEIWKPIIK